MFVFGIIGKLGHPVDVGEDVSDTMPQLNARVVTVVSSVGQRAWVFLKSQLPRAAFGMSRQSFVPGLPKALGLGPGTVDTISGGVAAWALIWSLRCSCVAG